jgi:hypothetical protein
MKFDARFLQYSDHDGQWHDVDGFLVDPSDTEAITVLKRLFGPDVDLRLVPDVEQDGETILLGPGSPYIPEGWGCIESGLEAAY